MSNLSKEIKTPLASLWKKRDFHALHATSKAGTQAELMRTNSSLNSARIVSVIFRGTCANEPILISEVFSDYLVSFKMADDNTIIPGISLVSSASPPRFSSKPSDVKPLLWKIRPFFHVGADYFHPALFKFWGANILIFFSNLLLCSSIHIFFATNPNALSGIPFRLPLSPFYRLSRLTASTTEVVRKKINNLWPAWFVNDKLSSLLQIHWDLDTASCDLQRKGIINRQIPFTTYLDLTANNMLIALTVNIYEISHL